MTPDEMDTLKKYIWHLNDKRSLNRNEVIKVVSVMRRLFNAYQGSIKKQYRLRNRLRKKHDENNGH